MTKFKDALDETERYSDNLIPQWGKEYYDTVIMALRIAQIVTGDPSKEAITKGGELLWTRADDTQDLDDRDIADTFRAMIEQMMREIGDIA